MLNYSKLIILLITDVAKSMDKALPEIEDSLGTQFARLGQRKDKLDASIFDTLDSERFSYSKGPLAKAYRA